MKKYLTSIFVLVFVQCFLIIGLKAHHQSYNDSLLLVLDKTQQDSTRVNILLGLVLKTPVNDTTKFNFLLQQIENLVENDKTPISASNLFIIGNLYEGRKNDLTKAVKYYESAISIAKKANNPDWITYEGWLGYIMTKTGDTEKAMIHLLNAKEEAESKQLEKKLPRTYLLLAFGFKETRDLSKSELYLKKCIDASLKIKDSSEIQTALHELGNLYILKKDFNNAIYYHKKALKIREKKLDTHELVYSYHDIAVDYMNIDSLETALEYFYKSEKLAELSENKWLLFKINSSIFDVLDQLGKDEKAESYLVKMQSLAKSLNIKPAYLELYDSYYSYYYNQGKYEKALYYYKASIAYHDSIFNEDIQKNIIELEKKYESAKKDKELIENQGYIKRQQIIIAFIVTGSSIIVFFLVLVFIQYRQKKSANILLESQNQEILLQKEELHTQAENLKLINNQLVEQRNEIETQREKLFELNATKDKFFSIMAHDLKNPFNSLLGMSDLLYMNAFRYPPEKVQKYAQTMHSSSKHAYTLLENLLEWSRLQTGKLTPKFTCETPSLLINEVKMLLEPAANAKNINLISDVIDDDPLVIDAQMTKTVLRNLVTNALKFTFPEGTIIIECEKRGREMVFSVSDTGIGIEPEHLNKLFRIDSKLSRNGTADEKGTGLGLILCKEFVEIQHGRIWVESEMGKGSTFRFTAPLGDLQQ